MRFLFIFILVSNVAFGQTTVSSEQKLMIAVNFIANDIHGAHPQRPKSERYPVVLTLPDNKLVWLGGIFDKHRDLNFQESASYPFFTVKSKDSLTIRLRVVNMRNKKISQWETQVYFDTILKLPPSLKMDSVLLINRSSNGSVSFLWRSMESKAYSWFVRREPNGIWDDSQYKTLVKEKYVPEQLRSDERFKAYSKF